MTYRTGRWPWALTCLVAAVTLGAVALTSAQEKPRSGGELIFVVPAEPPSFDAHREETFGMLHPAAPHYNTLLRVHPFDKTGTKFIGDLAESWTVSKDGLVYTFKLHKGVKFHDGSEMTSKDVKASYDKILSPPAGVKSLRALAYAAVQAVEAPDAHTVRFTLSRWPPISSGETVSTTGTDSSCSPATVKNRGDGEHDQVKSAADSRKEQDYRQNKSHF